MTAPVPDTDDLRSGAPLNDRLLALLPLLGTWRGEGVGIAPKDGATFTYGQQLRFVHDGRPFLAYEARSWLLDPDGTVLRQAWRESGFWRPGTGDDDLEVIIASNTGQALVFDGASGDLRWELATRVAEQSATAVAVDGERRLYALLGSELSYATELAPGGASFAPHLNARLRRSQ